MIAQEELYSREKEKWETRILQNKSMKKYAELNKHLNAQQRKLGSLFAFKFAKEFAEIQDFKETKAKKPDPIIKNEESE